MISPTPGATPHRRTSRVERAHIAMREGLRELVNQIESEPHLTVHTDENLVTIHVPSGGGEGW